MVDVYFYVGSGRIIKRYMAILIHLYVIFVVEDIKVKISESSSSLGK